MTNCHRYRCPIAKELLQLAISTASCTNCALCESRSQVVFGVGNPVADIMIVGSAPGFNEDQEGEPFLGAGGQLLNRMLEEIEISRADVYLSNVIKCRAPNDRAPKVEEVESCKGYLLEQMKLVEPRVVVALGEIPAQLLLKSEAPIAQLRGQTYDWWRGISLIPSYAPDEGLRGGPEVIDAIQADFILLRGVIDRPRNDR